MINKICVLQDVKIHTKQTITILIHRKRTMDEEYPDRRLPPIVHREREMIEEPKPQITQENIVAKRGPIMNYGDVDIFEANLFGFPTESPDIEEFGKFLLIFKILQCILKSYI